MYIAMLCFPSVHTVFGHVVEFDFNVSSVIQGVSIRKPGQSVKAIVIGAFFQFRIHQSNPLTSLGELFKRAMKIFIISLNLAKSL